MLSKALGRVGTIPSTGSWCHRGPELWSGVGYGRSRRTPIPRCIFAGLRHSSSCSSSYRRVQQRRTCTSQLSAELCRSGSGRFKSARSRGGAARRLDRHGGRAGNPYHPNASFVLRDGSARMGSGAGETGRLTRSDSGIVPSNQLMSPNAGMEAKFSSDGGPLATVLGSVAEDRVRCRIGRSLWTRSE